MKRLLPLFTYAFVGVEVCLWVLIQFTGGVLCTALCFSSVVLGFLYSLFALQNIEGLKERRVWLLLCGLATTVCADLCLVVLQPIQRLWGMVFFCFTQTFYFLYLYGKQEEQHLKRLHLLLRLGLTCLMPSLAYLVLGAGIDALAILSVIYFANLFCNIMFSKVKMKGTLLLFIGLISFALCDIMVGLSTLCDLYLTVDPSSFLYKLTHTGINLVWLFYVPSQTLIALHCVKEAKST